jgi:hypothetical protein
MIPILISKWENTFFRTILTYAKSGKDYRHKMLTITIGKYEFGIIFGIN